MAEKTRYMDIYKHLKDNGIDVYSPAQKKGECKKPYVVVKTGETIQYHQFSSTQTTYDIMCYVPENQYTKLEQYVEKVKGIMAQLNPMIKPLYMETESFFDDTVNAHMVSIQYRNMRKL